MAFDIAIDPGTCDLMMSPSMDFQGRVDEDTIRQRIRVRLRIPRGLWDLDPTGGTLGSRLHYATRVPTERALAEAELYVREALETMDDISVVTVNVDAVTNEPTSIQTTVGYVDATNPGDVPLDPSVNQVNVDITTV